MSRGGVLSLHGSASGRKRQSFHQPNEATTRGDVEDCDADRKKTRQNFSDLPAENVRQPKIRADLYRLVLVDFGRSSVPSSGWVVQSDIEVVRRCVARDMTRDSNIFSSL